MLNPSARIWILCFVAALRSLPRSIGSPRHRGLHAYLARAESDRAISEFQALVIQSILAMSEDSDFAIDYIEMAEAVAATDHERTVVGEARTARAWLQAHQAATSEYIQTTLIHDCEAVALWNKLLVALCRLGDDEPAQSSELRGPQAA